MARTKHRKGHKEASARRSAYNRLMHRIENAGQPVEVGKNRFKALPDFEEDVTVTVGGQTVPATITNEGTLRLEDGPDKGTLLHVDYRPIEERVMAQMLGPENFIIQGRGTGKSREVKNFIAQAEAAGRAVLRADVLKREILDQFGIEAQQDGETVYVSVPKRQVQDVVDLAQRRTYSMGCDFGAPEGDKTVVVEGLPGRRGGMSEKPTRGPVHLTDYVGEATAMETAMLGAAHLEPVWKRDENGKPCGIEEVSICPGPAPSGLTTIQPRKSWPDTSEDHEEQP